MVLVFYFTLVTRIQKCAPVPWRLPGCRTGTRRQCSRWAGFRESGGLVGLRYCPPSPARGAVSPAFTGVSQESTFWQCKLANIYKVTCHAGNTVTKDGVSPSSFGPPAPQMSATPIVRSKIQNCGTSSSHAHSKALDEKKRTDLWYS